MKKSIIVLNVIAALVLVGGVPGLFLHPQKGIKVEIESRTVRVGEAPETEETLRFTTVSEKQAIVTNRLVNVNTAGVKGLSKLKRLGEKTAARLIGYREAHGPFRSLGDLLAVPGIGKTTVKNWLDEITFTGQPLTDSERQLEGSGRVIVAGSSGTAMDLNSATSADLLQLPGVGSSTANKILSYRDANGGFSSVEDIKNVPGIGPRKYERLAPYLTVSGSYRRRSSEHRSTSPRRDKININTASTVVLQTLPGVGPKTAQRIVDYRDANGSFDSVDELTNVARIGEKTLARFREQVSVR